jgi:hypothetical protein
MNNPGHKIARWMMIILMIFVVAGTMVPRPAQAQWATFDALTESSTWGDFATNISDTVTTNLMEIKEYILDGLAWALAKALVQSMVASTVNWINSGFQGSPSFLTNPEGYFADVGDQVTGNFISNTGILSNLCSPFSADLRLALALGQAGYGSRYKCTLNSVIANVKNSTVNGMSIQGFMNGDFSQGGWPAFISLSEPQNNESSAYLQAHSDLLQQIGAKQSSINQQLTQGHGFLSFQSCTDVTASISGGGSFAPQSLGLSNDQYAQLQKNVAGTYNTGNGTSIQQTADATGEHYKQCSTQTPGSVISASLNKSLGATQDSLVTADEIDEVIGALMNQLVSTILTGGLHSASQKSSGQTQSFIDQMSAEQNPVLQSQIQKLVNNIGQYVAPATQDKAVLDQILGIYDDLKSFYVSLVAQCQSANSTSTAATVQGILDSQVTPLLTPAQTKDDQAVSELALLANLQATASSTDTTGLNQTAQQFTDMLQSGTVITALDVSNAKTDLKTATKTAATIRALGVPYQMLCVLGASTSTIPITIPAPAISSADITTGIITGTNFTYVTSVYAVSTLTNIQTDLLFTATSDTSLSVDFSSVPPGDSKLYVANPTGVSSAYKINIAQ